MAFLRILAFVACVSLVFGATEVFVETYANGCATDSEIVTSNDASTFPLTTTAFLTTRFAVIDANDDLLAGGDDLASTMTQWTDYTSAGQRVVFWANGGNNDELFYAYAGANFGLLLANGDSDPPVAGLSRRVMATMVQGSPGSWISYLMYSNSNSHNGANQDHEGFMCLIHQTGNTGNDMAVPTQYVDPEPTINHATQPNAVVAINNKWFVYRSNGPANDGFVTDLTCFDPGTATTINLVAGPTDAWQSTHADDFTVNDLVVLNLGNNGQERAYFSYDTLPGTGTSDDQLVYTRCVADGNGDHMWSVLDINPGAPDDEVANLWVWEYGNAILFQATDGATGVEPYRSGGSYFNTWRLMDITGANTDSDPADWFACNMFAFFHADDLSTYGRELYYVTRDSVVTRWSDLDAAGGDGFVTGAHHFACYRGHLFVSVPNAYTLDGSVNLGESKLLIGMPHVESDWKMLTSTAVQLTADASNDVVIGMQVNPQSNPKGTSGTANEGNMGWPGMLTVLEDQGAENNVQEMQLWDRVAGHADCTEGMLFTSEANGWDPAGTNCGGTNDMIDIANGVFEADNFITTVAWEDEDSDGVDDTIDNCPPTQHASSPGLNGWANWEQIDSDLDGYGDACDVCPGYNDFMDWDSDGENQDLPLLHLGETTIPTTPPPTRRPNACDTCPNDAGAAGTDNQEVWEDSNTDPCSAASGGACVAGGCVHPAHDTDAGADCGDECLGAGETCDDGNLVSGDGCDNHCQLEMCDGSGAPDRVIWACPRGAAQHPDDALQCAVTECAAGGNNPGVNDCSIIPYCPGATDACFQSLACYRVMDHGWPGRGVNHKSMTVLQKARVKGKQATLAKEGIAHDTFAAATQHVVGPNGDYLYTTDTLATVKGDPHFISFSGGKYEVRGEPFHFYNIISDKHLQYNARFIAGTQTTTWIDQIGVKFNGHTLAWDASSNNFTVDGKAVPGVASHKKMFEKLYLDTDGHAYVTISHNQHPSATRFYAQLPGFVLHITRKQVPRVLYVQRSHRIARMTGEDGKYHFGSRPWYFDHAAGHVDTGSYDPHGLLGQTVHFTKPVPQFRHYQRALHKNGEGVIEGVYTDYEVTGLLGDDFKYNRFEETFRV